MSPAITVFVVSPARRSVIVNATVELPPKSRRKRAMLKSALSQSCLNSRVSPAIVGHGVSSSAERYATLIGPSLPVTFAPATQGRGLATEALGAVVTRLFEQHDLHRVYAQADDRNVPVHRLLERLGFRCEARLVEADWFKGEWTTLRTYATLRREWRSP